MAGHRERDPNLGGFQGPQSYVTPFWYPSKQTDGKVVPAWNYVVVHAHGTLRFKRESQWLMDHLAELTRRRESRRAAPWVISDAPDGFIASQLKGLVGFEVEIKSLLGSWKLSQNKKAADSQGGRFGSRVRRQQRGCCRLAACTRPVKRLIEKY